MLYLLYASDITKAASKIKSPQDALVIQLLCPKSKISLEMGKRKYSHALMAVRDSVIYSEMNSLFSLSFPDFGNHFHHVYCTLYNCLVP